MSIPIPGVSIPIPGVSIPGVSSTVISSPSNHSGGSGSGSIPSGSDTITVEEDEDILNRDYTIIVDKSGSMDGKRWREAEEAVKLIAPRVCQFDADGISLYFFSNHFSKFENVKTAEDVMKLFKQNRPDGR